MKKKHTKQAQDRVHAVLHPSEIPADYSTISALHSVPGFQVNAVHYLIGKGALPAVKLKRTPTEVRGAIYVCRKTATALLAARLERLQAPASKPADVLEAAKVTDDQVVAAIGRLFNRIDRLQQTLDGVADVGMTLSHQVNDLRAIVECMEADVVRHGDRINDLTYAIETVGPLPTGEYDDAKEVRGNA